MTASNALSLPAQPSSAWRWSTPLVALAILLLVAALALGLTSSPAGAAERGTILQAGGDVTIPQADTAEAVIAIGGNVTVAGTVRTSIVAVGGDVRLDRTAVVGSAMQPGDTSIVLVGGTLTRAPGAQVTGQVSNVSGSWAGSLWNRGVTEQVTRPFAGFSFIAWLGGTALALLVAVLIAALAPRQITTIRERVRSSFWTSLGWGSLGLIILVPLITVLLVVTVIGILAVPPWLLVVVAALVMGYVGVSAALGRWALSVGGYKRENLMLASVVGVAILRVVALVPFLGGLVTFVASLVGFGATVIALWSWQRRRRELHREPGETQITEARAA